jgi:tetratricopeptide (TPR) repeat protein
VQLARLGVDKLVVWFASSGASRVSVVLLAATILFAGCEPGATTTSSQPTVGKPAAPSKATGLKSEAELLAELNRGFENPDVHCQLGQLYHSSKEWAKAEYHYNIALGFDPSHRPTQAAIVKLQLDRSNPARAETYARNYISQASGSVAELLKLGQEFSDSAGGGLNEYALTCFKQALSMADAGSGVPPGRRGKLLRADAYGKLGFYYLKTGDKTRAKEYLGRSFELNPNQPDVAGALGRLGVVVQVPREPEPPAAQAQQSKPKAPVK